MPLGAAGTHFTCFTRTKVQILTPEELQGLTQAYMKTGQTALAAAGTKVLALLVHTYLLYSYTRTNTERSGTRRGKRRSRQHVSVFVLSLLGLPVQTYKCGHAEQLSICLTHCRMHYALASASVCLMRERAWPPAARPDTVLSLLALLVQTHKY